jgi:Domain of unknown function (DUF3850)
MRVHELRIWPEFFAEVLDGRRSYEYRKDDRNFRVGDILHLQEFSPPVAGAISGQYTDRVIRAAVISICADRRIGIPEPYVILGIRLIDYLTGMK